MVQLNIIFFLKCFNCNSTLRVRELYVPDSHVTCPRFHVSNLRRRHSGPQGKVEPLTIIDDPADWVSSDWAGREDKYTYSFTEEVRYIFMHYSGCTCCRTALLLGIPTPQWTR